MGDSKGAQPVLSDVKRLYHSVKQIRDVEERVAEIYPSDKIKSPVHLSIGQEAVSVGVCDNLNSDDAVVGTYRGHALYLAKGGDLNRFMAELYGKVDGCARGKGGSMHMIDMSQNILGCSAVVSTNIPLAMGYAWRYKRENKGQVIACFFGDGATEEGVFYETLNFSALHKLPILFVCENNGMAIHTPLENRWSHNSLVSKVEGFGIESGVVENMDIFEIHKKAGDAIAKLRTGSGPQFMECHTYRWRQHVGPNEDFDAGYRSREEMAYWLEDDQVVRLAEMLEADDRAQIDKEISANIVAAELFAENSPFPETDELWDHVYAD